MAHRRTGSGRGGEHSEVTDNLALLVFGDSRKPPEYGQIFSRTAFNKFLRLYRDCKRGVKRSNKEQKVKQPIFPVCELLQKHIRVCLSKTFFDGYDAKKEKLREALAWHAQCWKEDEVDPSVAAAGVKKAFALWSEVSALG